MSIPPEDQAVILACSGLGSSRGATARPLAPKEWSDVADRAAAAKVGLADLAAMSSVDLEGSLRLAPELAGRLATLFARQGQLAIELERLERLGLWVVTTASPEYPERLRLRLGTAAPPVLYGLGERSILDGDALAVVGSRDASPDARRFARELGASAARQGWSLVSGAARGVDAESMRGAFDDGGTVIGVPADGLERYLRDASLRSAFSGSQAVYLSPFRPDAPFSVGNAMGRNRLIYCLARLAVVVDSAAGSGGTWAGATEALAKYWVPVLVRAGGEGNGNSELARRGGIELSTPDPDLASVGASIAAVPEAPVSVRQPVQETLF